MKDFAITLCLGWLGVHRFMQKKYGTGILWLCTFGLFGIGWIVDIIAAFTKSSANNQNRLETRQEGITFSNQPERYIKSFDTVIVGTFAKCSLDKNENREDLIRYVKPKWELSLQYWEYNGEPAYYVLHPNGLDLGNIRAGLAKILHDEYSDCKLKVTAMSKAYDDKNDSQTYNIRIDVYK